MGRTGTGFLHLHATTLHIRTLALILAVAVDKLSIGPGLGGLCTSQHADFELT